MDRQNSFASVKKFSVAPKGAGDLFAARPRPYARGYTLPPVSAGSLSNLFKLALLFVVLLSNSATNAQPARSPAPVIIESSSFDKEVTDFFTREMTAHLDEIKSYDPPPDK